MTDRSGPSQTMPPSAAERYGSTARRLHWMVALLLIGPFATKLLLPAVLPRSAAPALNSWHFSLGLTILAVMVFRLAWRVMHPPPAAPRHLSQGLRVVAGFTHWAFYVGLIVLPLLGWITANFYGVPVRLFGMGPLPSLAAKNLNDAEWLGSLHGALAFLLLALVALHVAGAIFHALVKRDGVLQRMLPTVARSVVPSAASENGWLQHRGGRS